jgi:hypothetical protein
LTVVVVAIVVVVVVVVVAVAIDGAVGSHVSNLSAAKAATEVGEASSFIFREARGMTIVVIVAVAIVVVVVVVVVIVVVVIVTRVIVVTMSHVLLPSFEAFVHIMELNTNIVNFHGCRLGGGGGGEGREGGDKRGRAVGGGVGSEGVNAIHLGCIVEEFREGGIRVLKDISFNQLLQGQGTVVNKGCLGKLVDCDFGGLIGGVTKEST